MPPWLTPKEAVLKIAPGERIGLGAMCAEPPILANELASQSDRLQGSRVYQAVLGSPCPYAGSHEKGFKIGAFLFSSALKEAYAAKRVDYLPINFCELPRFFEDYRVDTALIQVAPPKDGRVSLGIACDYTLSLALHARRVIAEVNPLMPEIPSEGLIELSRIDALVEGGLPPWTLTKSPPSDEELAIARHVASLIPDGATIEVGVGSLGGAVLEALSGKKDLGLHSGTFPKEAFDLLDNGTITNQKKPIDKGLMIASSLAGSALLYDRAKNEPTLRLMPSSYTHGAGTLSKIPNFFAINQAIEVDLAGQVNSEWAGGLPVGGVGGLMDFLRGAVASKGGASIIAMPSQARNGSVSRIVPKVERASATKSDVHFIVTEWGIASLFGKTLQERALALIAIAHPNFRPMLESALKAGLWALAMGKTHGARC